ncbi:Helix-turn-helix [Hydrobacter penzbergensis]|uniref:Helix-turn-helix n=1 Tax=Hydrobacter penzbergensis TaxID=1235997 RepID=A0A8X8IGF0_9BACT|nr:helix-turn-helix transcriptional regulator [Hydrobacter penzbergensis]SDX22878.1 Helix-turn-helix [Hydrobacter penzbergensis]
MNTNINPNNERKSNPFFRPRSLEKEIQHEANMLMSNFLNQIETFQDEQSLSRKELAVKIGTSSSYLTQLFRNKKPLNFITLAKIQRALGIKFLINAKSIDKSENIVDYNMAGNITAIENVESIPLAIVVDMRDKMNAYNACENLKYTPIDFKVHAN